MIYIKKAFSKIPKLKHNFSSMKDMAGMEASKLIIALIMAVVFIVVAMVLLPTIYNEVSVATSNTTLDSNKYIAPLSIRTITATTIPTINRIGTKDTSPSEGAIYLLLSKVVLDVATETSL